MAIQEAAHRARPPAHPIPRDRTVTPAAAKVAAAPADHRAPAPQAAVPAQAQAERVPAAVAEAAPVEVAAARAAEVVATESAITGSSTDSIYVKKAGQQVGPAAFRRAYVLMRQGRR